MQITLIFFVFVDGCNADMYVRRFAQNRAKRTPALSGSFEAQVLTATGVKTSALFDFSSILAILTKYKPELNVNVKKCYSFVGFLALLVIIKKYQTKTIKV